MVNYEFWAPDVPEQDLSPIMQGAQAQAAAMMQVGESMGRGLSTFMENRKEEQRREQLKEGLAKAVEAANDPSNYHEEEYTLLSMQFPDLVYSDADPDADRVVKKEEIRARLRNSYPGFSEASIERRLAALTEKRTGRFMSDKGRQEAHRMAAEVYGLANSPEEFQALMMALKSDAGIHTSEAEFQQWKAEQLNDALGASKSEMLMIEDAHRKAGQKAEHVHEATESSLSRDQQSELEVLRQKHRTREREAAQEHAAEQASIERVFAAGEGEKTRTHRQRESARDRMTASREAEKAELRRQRAQAVDEAATLKRLKLQLQHAKDEAHATRAAQREAGRRGRQHDTDMMERQAELQRKRDQQVFLRQKQLHVAEADQAIRVYERTQGTAKPSGPTLNESEEDSWRGLKEVLRIANRSTSSDALRLNAASLGFVTDAQLRDLMARSGMTNADPSTLRVRIGKGGDPEIIAGQDAGAVRGLARLTKALFGPKGSPKAEKLAFFVAVRQHLGAQDIAQTELQKMWDVSRKLDAYKKTGKRVRRALRTALKGSHMRGLQSVDRAPPPLAPGDTTGLRGALSVEGYGR